MSVTYEYLHGQGSRRDYLHVTTDFREGPRSYNPREVIRWIHRVHPNTKELFVDRLNATLKRERIDLIGKRLAPGLADAGSWRLRIQSAAINLDIVMYDLIDLDPGQKDPFGKLWNDPDLLRMRNFVSDLRLMAELYAIRMPEELMDISAKPNPSPLPTSGLRPAAADL